MDGHDTCDTVLIKDEKGKLFRINADAYDAKKHKLAKLGDAPEEQPELKPAPTGQLTISKNGKAGRGSKFIIVDDKGEKVGEDEYNNEGEAFAAMAALQKPAGEGDNTGNGQ